MPGCNSLSFASPKESKQRKGDPVRRPCASLRARCGARKKRGHVQTRFAQTSTCPDPLFPVLLASSPRVGGKFGFGGSPLPEGEGGSPSPNSIPHPVLAGLRSVGVSGNKFLDVRRRQSRLVSKNSADFEHRKAPEAKRRDPDCGSPFLCLLSFGEAKESELQPGNPRHARKGNRSNQSAVAARGQ